MAMRIIWFILLGSLYLFLAMLLFKTSPILSSLIVFVGFLHFYLRGVRPTLKRRRRIRKARKAVAACILPHVPVLARKRGLKVKPDDYGIIHYEEWEQEKQYFIDIVLGEAFGGILREGFPISLAEIDLMIEHAIDGFVSGMYGRALAQEPDLDCPEGDDRYSYRHYCAKLLELSGWKVLTGGEQDPAADPILAEREGERFVVMCVDASSPAGSGFIRRAWSARKKLGAQSAAVVSAAGFSRLARMVSPRCRVRLLHHEDLANI